MQISPPKARFPSGSAAIIRSRSASCAAWPRRWDRSRSCSSTPTATRGTTTGAFVTRTARRFAGRSRKDSSTSSTRSRLACAARSTLPGDLDESRRLGFEVMTTPQMLKRTPADVAKAIRERVGDVPAFLTFDVDFFDPAYAPGTGTPEVGGPTSAFGLEIVQHLAGIPFVGFDTVEVLPALDPTQTTALLAATLVFEFIALVALSPKKAQATGGRPGARAARARTRSAAPSPGDRRTCRGPCGRLPRRPRSGATARRSWG